MAVMKTLKVDNIRIDGGTQAREEIDNDAVKDYRDIHAFIAGAKWACGAVDYQKELANK